MRISTKRNDALYRAISETIMDVRIEVAKHANERNCVIDANVIDRKLYDLENRIAHRVYSVLGIVV